MAHDMPEFQDFELLIGPARQPGVYPVNVTQSPAGRASSAVLLDPIAPAVRSVLDDIANRATNEDLLIQFGRMLFKALMPDPIEDLYRRSQGTDQRLRLRLCIEPPELAALPWEYLHDPSADLSLAISPRHCLSRYLPVNEPVPTLEVKPPLRVLVVVSDPRNLQEHGMPPLDAAEEIKRIRSALNRLTKAGQVKLEILPHAVGPDLRESLRTYRPHVLHFIGHGEFQNEQGVLVMEDEDNNVRFVSDRQFREFFLQAQDVKLVILNACQGATQSSTQALAGLAPQIVRRGLGAVIAMQYPIPDKVSLLFARELYRAIAQYYPVDVAVAEARRAVYQDFGLGQPDWGTPVIFMRAPDGRLFSSSQAGPEAPAQTEAGSAVESKPKETPVPAQDSYQYDVFISYSHRDADWVQNWLLPNVEAAGLQACIDVRNFQPGAPSVTEMERAVLQSRKTILVLTPDYLASQWADFENIMLQTLDPAARQRRLIPLLLKPCNPPIRIRMLTYLDMTQPASAATQFGRLIAALRPESAPTSQPVFTPPPLPATETRHESDKKGTPMADITPQQLREALVANLNLDELQTLCDDLRDNLDNELDFDNLGGEGKTGKARELVDFLRRRSLLPAAVDYIRRNRPKIKL